jgi:hypothetical protein
MIMHADTRRLHAYAMHALAGLINTWPHCCAAACAVQENKKVQEISGNITKAISSSPLLQ